MMIPGFDPAGRAANIDFRHEILGLDWSRKRLD
jgi:hypothetical protein